MITLSKSQQQVLDQLVEWLQAGAPERHITVGGYAGTGKTTLTAELRSTLHRKWPQLNVAFCSFTGKATQVLRSKLKQANVLRNKDTVGTIHSLIYEPVTNNRGEVVGWDRKDIREQGLRLIIVDEASMIDQFIWQDLRSFDIPIIAIGDHGQLPPIQGEFNLMESPQLELTEIHRQAAGNPIVKLSMLAREEGKVPIGDYAKGVKKFDRHNSDAGYQINELLMNWNPDTLILCGYNHTRQQINQNIRQVLEFHSPQPQPGERVICLRNNRNAGIYNGMLGTIKSIEEVNVESKDDPDYYFASIAMDGESVYHKLNISAEQFGHKQTVTKTDKQIELFDFGYALTVHKAQGSQAPRVILFEERFKQMDDNEWRRWLYTGITRAESELFIIGS